MKRKRLKNTKKQIKYIIGGSILLALVTIGILLAIFIPTAKAKSELANMYNDLRAMKDPVMIITDMKADNNFSTSRGEEEVEGKSNKEILINDLFQLEGRFDYVGKSKTGAWDLRIRIFEGDNEVELYLAYEEMYYVKDNVKYIFTPDAGAAEAYKILYKNFYLWVK